jgi:hypothetical protein
MGDKVTICHVIFVDRFGLLFNEVATTGGRIIKPCPHIYNPARLCPPLHPR